jgi:hypothetical protein
MRKAFLHLHCDILLGISYSKGEIEADFCNGDRNCEYTFQINVT